METLAEKSPYEKVVNKMSADRERLIELLREAHKRAYREYFGFCNMYEVYADHLIANGVTVQKWIPVTERLPENNDVVLGLAWNEAYWFVRWNERYREWEDWFTNESCSHSEDSVTHWMPLPEPPKEG